ncbi:MAG: formylglycine-generating enzyme family protein [Deltaproteobacteria bacterium]|nr:formylglycine-generating enzyme family protein [Deltaproteobacteria bacterium]
MKRVVFFIAMIGVCIVAEAEVSPPNMSRVGPGPYRPLYPPTDKEKEIAVDAFFLDRRPVTNTEFLAFVRENAKWRRDKISGLFADERYLSHWTGSLDLGPGADAEQPVTFVSWFAAKAYCESRGGRLPYEAEWELAAAANESSADAKDDPVWQRRILDWYSKPAGRPLGKVGRSVPNYWGVFDLHGLIWEWVYDYNAALVGGDNREQGGTEKLRFCGTGALKASDKNKYADFMRIAFRSSLEARYTVGHLGFRCARDLEDK